VTVFDPRPWSESDVRDNLVPEENMRLGKEQVASYAEHGFLILENVFDRAEVDFLRDVFDRDSAISGEHRIMESGGAGIRSVYASHLRQPEFAALVRSRRLLGPARQLLGGEVYLYQLKVNSKAPFTGGGWSWHQDYTAWRLVDHLPAPLLINVALLLDDVTEHNGPLLFVPGSHRHRPGGDRPDRPAPADQHLDPDDIALGPDELRPLVDRYGIRGGTAPAGSVVLFHPEIVHGSGTNMSPYPRRLLITTYNDLRNRPLGRPRAEYLVGRGQDALRYAEGELVGTDGGPAR
jgi:ectoine hydroxylase